MLRRMKMSVKHWRQKLRHLKSNNKPCKKPSVAPNKRSKHCKPVHIAELTAELEVANEQFATMSGRLGAEIKAGPVADETAFNDLLARLDAESL